jgi:hypothetical protein
MLFDAVKLLHLNAVKSVVIYVLIHKARQETFDFNPFYSVRLGRFK